MLKPLRSRRTESWRTRRAEKRFARHFDRAEAQWIADGIVRAMVEQPGFGTQEQPLFGPGALSNARTREWYEPARVGVLVSAKLAPLPQLAFDARDYEYRYRLPAVKK